MKPHASLFAAAVAALLPGAAQAATTINLSAAADTALFHRDGTFAYNTTNYGTATELNNYQNGTGIWAMSYVRFDLSAIPAGATITSATLTLTKGTATAIAATTFVRNDTINTGRFGVFGLLDVADNTAQNWGETTLTANGTTGLGLEVTGGTNPQFDAARTISLDGVGEFVTGGTSAGVTASTAGDLLLTFLQGRLDATAHTGLATFMVDFVAAGTGQGYAFNSRESATGQPVLSVTYETVPEPAAAGIGAIGLLALLRRRRA